MTARLRLFAQLQKIDVEKREVHGRAVAEVPDRAREIFDYATSKPNFEKWSNDFAKATATTGQEQSLGNVRAMHGKVAAGKLTSITFNDAEKAIDIVAKIEDDNEWRKVQSGVYTGYSIGGSYAERWQDTAQPTLMRYTAAPAEISLVDYPCVPTATFAMVKAGGATEMQKFQHLAVLHELVAPNAGLTKGEALDLADEYLASDTINRLHNNDGTFGDLLDELRKFAAEPAEKIAERKDTSPKEGERKYGDATFADPTNKKYPIDSAKEIRAAWSYINMPKNAGKYSAKDAAAIKRRIVSAWKKKIDSKGPPSAEKMAKSMYDIARMADLLQSIKYMAECAASERVAEGDDSAQPEKIEAWLKDGVELLHDMLAEEGAELTGDDPDDSDPEDLAMSAKIDELAKLLAEHKDLTAAEIAETLNTGKVPTREVEKVAGAEALAKLGEKFDTGLAKMAESIDALGKRIKVLEDQPAPTKVALRSVEKSTEMGGGTTQETVDENDPISLMKAAQRNPQVMAGR